MICASLVLNSYIVVTIAQIRFVYLKGYPNLGAKDFITVNQSILCV